MRGRTLMVTRLMLTYLTIALTGGLGGGALAQQNKTEEQRSTYYDSFPGKKIVFVPMSMGFDLTELWAAQMRSQAHELGYSFGIRDPNWSSDAGSKAITALITEKPNIIVVQNLDVQV